MSGARVRRGSSAALPLLVLLSSLVRADDTPVLHEFIPNIGDSDLDFVDGEGEPSILYEGELLSAPTGGGLRQGEVPVGARRGNAATPTFRPDRVTSLDGQLQYSAVFTPSVAPFKRTTSLDAVVRLRNGVPVLGIARPDRSPITIEGPGVAPPDSRPRDRFWGSLVLDFREGNDVPFPSVSPESRVLSLRTEPPTDLRLERDESGNFNAHTNQPAGQVRVVFLMDAPRAYFAAETIPNVSSDLLSDELYPLDDALQSDGLRFAAELGIERGDPMPEVLSTLTRHFRSFVESDLPPDDTGNIYLDLARSGRGVCRHRSYAFLITAQALGIPTRFVHNEAHAWVEVKIVEVGWMRIDLGGAAGGLDTSNASDRPIYRAPYPDPLPRPPSYTGGYSQLAGNVSGLRPDEAAAANLSAATDPQDTSSDAPQNGQAQNVASQSDVQTPSNGRAQNTTARPLRIILDQSEHEALRGRSVPISGRALDPEGNGVGGLRIEIAVRRRSRRLLGVTVTNANGQFQTTVGVPPDLGVGDWVLSVRTPGNEDYFPAQAH
ncbi:MAG: transglutaminase domain-containing protein [Polyangiales bacterium]